MWAGLLVILCLLSFWPAVSGQFIWDDNHQVAAHLPAMEGAAGFEHIWLPPISTIQYYPLTNTLFWIQWHLWGNAPLSYHLLNLLLHAGSAVLLWRLLRRLGVPGAWVAAAIWAIHPLQAESVCWISELKNILSGLLFFASLWFFLDFAGVNQSPIASAAAKWKLPAWLAFALSFAFFLLAVLAKSVVCSLPVVVLIVLWWKRRIRLNALLALAPFLIFGLAMASVTSHIETDPLGVVRATGPEWNLQPAQRLLIAGRGVWFYAAKLLLPDHLCFNYPRIVPDASDARQWLYVIAAASLLALPAGLLRVIGRGPLAAALYYGAVLFPALGFVNVFPFRYSFVADHFQYLAGLGLIVLVVAAAAWALRKIQPLLGPSMAPRCRRRCPPPCSCSSPP